MVFSTQNYWQFSLGHYARAGVQPACLALQNRYQGNVNLALLLHWLDSLHYRLPDCLIRELSQSLGESDRVLGQYRTMRKALKPQLDHGGYQRLLQFELTLEKQQQRDLIAQVNDSGHRLTSGQHPAQNLRHYCGVLNANELLPALQSSTGTLRP